jgi:hypothetical protein
MKRTLWTIGVAFVGFFIGGEVGAASGAVAGSVWGASIGLGFGTIFCEQRATKLLVAYWAATLGLVGPLFGVVIEAVPKPSVSPSQLIFAAFAGALAGVLVGAFSGFVQWKCRVWKAHRPALRT